VIAESLTALPDLSSFTLTMMSLLCAGVALALARTVLQRREAPLGVRPLAEHARRVPVAVPVLSRRVVATELPEQTRARWTR